MRTPVIFLITTILFWLSIDHIVAAASPFVGKWKWDNDKTLQNMVIPIEGSDELKQAANRAKRFVKAVKEKLNSNVTLDCLIDSCIETIYDQKNNVLSKETIPYKIVRSGDNFIIIDNFQKSGVQKLTFEGKSFYVEVKVGDYIYRDYFTSVP